MRLSGQSEPPGGVLGGAALWRRCVAAQPSLPRTYAAYSHWRRLGWVPRDGLQYGVTFLLYRGGAAAQPDQGGARPAHTHAEYCVAVVDGPAPAPAAATTPAPAPLAPAAAAAAAAEPPILPCWRSLQAMQRVSASVAKALLVCMVTTAPPHPPADGSAAEDTGAGVEGGWAPPAASVRVVEVSRWAPQRSRKAPD